MPEPGRDGGVRREPRAPGDSGRASRYADRVLAANYRSGDDFVVEFLGHRFEFNAEDFEERVTAAAVKLDLIASNEVDPDEAADLVELVADGRIGDPRIGLQPGPSWHELQYRG